MRLHREVQILRQEMGLRRERYSLVRRFIRSRSAFGIIGDLHSGGAHAAGMLKEP
jgi:hypothetical protein